MKLEEAIDGRRSVREYTRDAVDEKTIRSLIDAAAHAPNAVNQQPWTFTVVRDQAVLERISSGAKLHMLATMPAGNGTDHLRPQLRDAAFHIFYHAPVLILISASAEGPWIVEDCALAAENLMLAAHGAGLGTCWIGFAQGFLNTREGKELLGLPGGDRDRADHRRPSQAHARAGPAPGAGDPLDRLSASIARFIRAARGAARA